MTRCRTHLPKALAAVLGVTVMVLTGCTATGAERPETGLERFYAQQLTFEPCLGYGSTAADAEVLAADAEFQCARMEAPLDYRDPGGQTIQIALLRAPARGERVGSLLLNPGGPGGSGVVAAAATSAALRESRITERFDLVGFDPRGVGASRPAVDCFTDAEADAGTVATSAIGTVEPITAQHTAELVERCAAGTGGVEVLKHFGTRDAARDMDLLRAVLGEERLSYLGQSYGTRLGAVYAETFPDRVRAMVLDGAIDPRQGTFERRVYAYRGFQRSFDQLAAFCARQPDCPLGPDPAQATAVLQQILRPLLERPLPALDGFELTFDAATGGIISGLYHSGAWPAIISGIREVQAGRGDTLVALGHAFAGRGPEGRWPNFAEALFAINCMDEQRMTPEQTAELRSAVFAAAPFLDPGIDLSAVSRDTCEAWPASPNLGIPYAENVTDLPPTLVVSITGDPTTPHGGGLSLADALGATLLTVEGEQHTVVTGGTNTCVDEIAADYLVDLRLPAEGTTCTL